MRIGKCFAQSHQGRRGHHRVAQPVDSANQNSWSELRITRLRIANSLAGAGVFNFRLSTLNFGRCGFPSFVDPEPVRRIAAHGGFMQPEHIPHDIFDRPGMAIFVRGNLFAQFQPPFGQADADSRPRRKVRNRNAGQKSPGTGWWNSHVRETAGATRGRHRVGQSANRE